MTVGLGSRNLAATRGELENMLVRPKHRCRWRLDRLGQVESSIFTYKYYGTLSAALEMETMQKANSTLLRQAS